MGKGLFVVGSDTDVGKTFVTAGLTYVLNKTSQTIAYKPIQSGGEYKTGVLKSMDVDFIKFTCQLDHEDELMNSYCFEAAVSPHIAAEREGIVIDFDMIQNHARGLMASFDYTLVEGAGGVVVPLTRDVYIYDLVKKLNLGVVLVTRPGVGTINHTCLTYAFLQDQGIEVKSIIVNGFRGTYYEIDNLRIIREKTGIEDIITLDYVDEDMDLHETFDRCFKVDLVKKWFE
jgi:dethiobiotin synthetase